ncbi:class I tRNA ligase family protein [archaeon]|nr:class I tRNA ligase family protein [archaeon]
MEINFKGIEKKWQKRWAEAKIFETGDDDPREKFYVLEMFPYPSGSGLHMGHAWNYTIGDILARFKIMSGFNVIHPMGYDALGLPAENAAIEAGEHPEDYNKKSIANYIKQQKALGLSYDWSRMISTDDPKFYRWDQWIFLKMFEKGLAYQKESAVNWCPECNTVLANEQVHDGNCWRHEDSSVEVKHLKQWFFKITDYADELYEGLNDIDWPETTKTMQRNWIGKSYGTEIMLEVEGGEKGNVVIVHGSQFLNANSDKGYFEPNEQPWMLWIKNKIEDRIKVDIPLMPNYNNPVYEDWKNEFEKLGVNENTILIGHSLGCAFLVRWLGETKTKIKKLILIAPAKKCVLKYYNEKAEVFYDFKIDKDIKKNISEIIIFTTNNDYEEIMQGSKLYNEELGGELIELKNHGHFIKKHMGTNEFPELLDKIIGSQTWPIFTTRPDTLFGVTFMVVSAQHQKLMDLVKDSEREKVEEFLKGLGSVSEKELGDMEKKGVFSGSYAVNPINGERIPVYVGNFVVADYGSGMVMGVPAHDKRDFEFARKYGIDVKEVVKGGDISKEAYVDSGDLVNSGDFNGMNNNEAKERITQHLESKGLGKKVVNFKLRDWGISRQRYWGTPIPIIHCKDCGAVPVPEDEFPVKLPRKVKFGDGNPLLTNEKWVNVKCPKCGKKAKRETDTMDTFVNSSWYFLRFCDPNNDESIFDSEKVKSWCPVDRYVGGQEHACMHLIYSRFYVKFLRDLGMFDFGEPFASLFHQGMLHAEDGSKMSKSKGNVVLPESVSDKYGIDTARFFLSSLASPDKDIDWSERGIIGSLRFVKRIFGVFDSVKIDKDSAKLESKVNEVVRNVSKYYDEFLYRKATIEIRELFDLIASEKEASMDTLEKFLKLLSPICPHISEELWEKLGNKVFVSDFSWPEFDESKIEKKSEMMDLNGKIIERVKGILKKGTKKVYVYVMPFEREGVDVGRIGAEIEREVEVFTVNDSEKIDPKNMAKKAKPGMPSVYLE